MTIVGAGGIGKTRVAQAVAHALRDELSRRRLAGRAGAAGRPGAASRQRRAGAGASAAQPDAPLDELVTLLRSQRLLLVLDNCEHLLEAARRWRRRCLTGRRRRHVLATSQEPLRLPDEQLYRLGTLAVPSDGEPADAAQALELGAVRLFVERAQALDPRFRARRAQRARR